MFSWTLQPTFSISPPVFQEFVRCSNKDIEQIIKKEMSGDVKNAMFAIGKIFVSSMTQHQKNKSLIIIIIIITQGSCHLKIRSELLLFWFQCTIKDSRLMDEEAVKLYFIFNYSIKLNSIFPNNQCYFSVILIYHNIY